MAVELSSYSTRLRLWPFSWTLRVEGTVGRLDVDNWGYPWLWNSLRVTQHERPRSPRNSGGSGGGGGGSGGGGRFAGGENDAELAGRVAGSPALAVRPAACWEEEVLAPGDRTTFECQLRAFAKRCEQARSRSLKRSAAGSASNGTTAATNITRRWDGVGSPSQGDAGNNAEEEEGGYEAGEEDEDEDEQEAEEEQDEDDDEEDEVDELAELASSTVGNLAVVEAVLARAGQPPIAARPR